MNDFVDYAPRAHSLRRDASIGIRQAVLDDVDCLAAVMAVRGGEIDEHIETAGRLLSKLSVLLVAECDAELVGWSGIQRYSIHPEAEPEWLVAGLTVAPAVRRQGIAERLLRGVLDRTADSAPEEPIFSVVNARNLASIDLHAKLEFIEAGRAASYAGIEFTGGESVLLKYS